VISPKRAKRKAIGWLFRVPVWFYRVGLGWLLGRRFLLLTHRGRITGRVRHAVLEVISFDTDSQESVVVSAYGSQADWYRNIRTSPALRIRTGRLDYIPRQRFLTIEEASEVAVEFARNHPWELRLLSQTLPVIGALDRNASRPDPVNELAALPMVGFAPEK